MPKDSVDSTTDNGTRSLCSCDYYSVSPLVSERTHRQQPALVLETAYTE